ncbi:MAG TPA: DUF72 domain-containing protein [Lacunisphaera sp.]|nr:DUF72 domain-containing protein [Lacunisphaera sp.]
MEIHIGCSGWFYSHWRGIFYPAREVGTALWFAYYANVFRTVELNAPFYRCMSAASRRALAETGHGPPLAARGAAGLPLLGESEPPHHA